MDNEHDTRADPAHLPVPVAHANTLSYRIPKNVIVLPKSSPQPVAVGVPDSPLTREATGLLQQYSTPLLINHSHRVFRWADELGRRTGEPYDAELLFVCAAFHDLGLLQPFRSADNRFEVDGANAARQFLDKHDVSRTRTQTAWDAIALHTTPGLAAYKPLEVELLQDGVIIDVMGRGHERINPRLRDEVVAAYPRVDFRRQIAQAFFDGFGHKSKTTEGTCNEDICAHFTRNYQRSDFFAQIQSSQFPDA